MAPAPQWGIWGPEDATLGRNPFIDASPAPPPAHPYRVRLKNTGQVFEVNPAVLPTGYDGLPGSLLATLLSHGVEIDHSCGGVVACSTCHIYVRAGLQTAPPPIEEEEDMLDFAPALDPSSRLSCQCVPDGSKDVEVEIPLWKRNEVSEGDL